MKDSDLKYCQQMRMGWLLMIAVSVSCTKSNPGATCSDGSCSDPAFPYCDSDGLVGGEAGTCIAVTCTPGEIKTCDGDNAVTCSSNGAGYERDPCALGCASGPTPHCKYLQPRYLADVCDAPATAPSIGFTSSGVLDPNLDTNCNGGVVAQTGAPSICVLRYGTVSIDAGSELKIPGTQTALGRAIALVADQDISVAGTIDVGAHQGFNGPGGGSFQSGGTGGGTGANAKAAGGAGGATAGGAGGNATTDGGAQNGGLQTENPALLAELVGGASVTRVTNDASISYSLGGGGGALALISCHGTVNVAGTINAGGGGGPASGAPLGIVVGGYAGGAGGNVVIQGVHVEVTGEAYANGGGGGGGVLPDGTSAPGEDARASDTQAASGGVTAGTGLGGAGGIGQHPPGSGGHPPATTATAGGGGGSVGFLQVYTPAGIAPTVTPSHASPAFQPNGTVQTR